MTDLSQQSPNVSYATDAAGNVTGLVTPGGCLSAFGGTHVRATLLGDSITARNFQQGTPPVNSSSSGIGWNNWTNQLLGSPFVFMHNLGYSGDTTTGICSRVSSIQPNVQCVWLMAGTNDVNNCGATASGPVISAAYTLASNNIRAAVNALTASGKVVILATILPNDNWTATDNAGGPDARIPLLDNLNTFIKSLADGATVFVGDAFTALWDNTQPTARVSKSGTLNTSDKTHPTSKGCQLIALAMWAAAASAYSKCVPDVNIYDEFQPTYLLYNEFRSSTGGNAGTITNGTGTIADGWRSINNAGTPTFTINNSAAYTKNSNFVGHWARLPVGPNQFVQEFNVTSAVANDNPRLRNPSNSDFNNGGSVAASSQGIYAGAELFGEIEVSVANPVNLQEVSLTIICYLPLLVVTGSITASVLTVTASTPTNATVPVGSILSGTGITGGGATVVTQQLSANTYSVIGTTTAASTSITVYDNAQDVPYLTNINPVVGNTYLAVKAGTAGDSASSMAALTSGYSSVLRTPVMRIPENIYAAGAMNLIFAADIIFLGAGSADVKFARPRLWNRISGRIG